jgi:hypothetical protein
MAHSDRRSWDVSCGYTAGRCSRSAIGSPDHACSRGMHPQPLVHGRDWSVYTHPRDWAADFKSLSFGSDCTGILLVGDSGKRGLVVSGTIDCCYLDLNDWIVHDPNSESYMSTRRWNIVVPSNSPDRADCLLPG